MKMGMESKTNKYQSNKKSDLFELFSSRHEMKRSHDFFKEDSPDSSESGASKRRKLELKRSTRDTLQSTTSSEGPKIKRESSVEPVIKREPSVESEIRREPSRELKLKRESLEVYDISHLPITSRVERLTRLTRGTSSLETGAQDLTTTPRVKREIGYPIKTEVQGVKREIGYSIETETPGTGTGTGTGAGTDVGTYTGAATATGTGIGTTTADLDPYKDIGIFPTNYDYTIPMDYSYTEIDKNQNGVQYFYGNRGSITIHAPYPYTHPTKSGMGIVYKGLNVTDPNGQLILG